jgi:hypothetical protein
MRLGSHDADDAEKKMRAEKKMGESTTRCTGRRTKDSGVERQRFAAASESVTVLKYNEASNAFNVRQQSLL